MSLFIKDILYLPMTGTPQLKKGSIRMEGQRITEIGDIAPKWGDDIIFGHDKIALPGFVNGHCHAAMTLLRGYGEDLPLQQWLQLVQNAEKYLTGEDLFWGSLLAQLEMLKAGITCYADMYFDEGASAWAMEESGIRGVLGNGLTDHTGNGDVYLRDMTRLIDDCKNDLQGRLTFAFAPHAPYSCSGGYLREVAQEAAKRNLPLHIHLAETRKEQEDCLQQNGKRVMHYLNDLGILNQKVFAAHMIHLDDSELDLVKAKDIRVIHCPQSNMKLASGVLRYPEMKARGITVGLGTDGAASNNDLDMLEEMRTASLLQKVASGNPAELGAYESLAAATVNGAKALFLDDSIGTLEVGKKADITILSLWRPHFYPRNEQNSILQHLAYAAKNGDVHTVIVNGKVRISGGRCTDIDEGRVYHEVQRRAEAFWKRQ